MDSECMVDYGRTLEVQQTYRCPECQFRGTGYSLSEAGFIEMSHGVKCPNCERMFNR